MKLRTTPVASAALLALAFSPGMASAQFVSGMNTPFFRAGIFPGGYPIPNPLIGLNQTFNPIHNVKGLQFNTPFVSAGGTFGPNAYGRASRNISVGGMNFSRQVSSSYSTYYRFYGRLPYAYVGNFVPAGSHSGSLDSPFKPPAANQRMIGNAQMTTIRNNDAEPRKMVFDQWAYEKLGVAALKDLAVKDAPPELQKALSITDEGDIVSGEPLNHILVASVALEKKGAKAAGVALPPDLLSEVNFGGSASAEALNTLRHAGKLQFTSLFESDKMRVVRDDLEKALSAVAVTASTGKPVNQVTLARLTDEVQRARDKVSLVSRDKPFEEALAARRFLNDLDNVAKVLKDNSMAGLLDARWATEGSTVPDLIRHMAKYKVLFGPAPRDGSGAEAYVAMHKGLAAYHAVLSQQPLKK
jgi:hypothetical protein